MTRFIRVCAKQICLTDQPGPRFERQTVTQAVSADVRHRCEPVNPEDTFDGDSGRLLDRAYESSVRVLASPMPASWNQIETWLLQIDGLDRTA